MRPSKSREASSRRSFSIVKSSHHLILIITLFIAIGARTSTSSSTFDYEPDQREQVPVNSIELVATASSAGSVQCEPVNLKLCAHLGYNHTRMPNFFGDPSQVEASQRSLQFMSLVSTKCSAYLHAYICELIAPVCIKDGPEVMRRFEIYPCRPFCRRVKRECELEIAKHEQHLTYSSGVSIMSAFNCDQLPFEINGGNRTLEGPCHDEKGVMQQAQVQPGQQSDMSSYRPFQPEHNFPPFITDTSPLNRNIVLPAVSKFPTDLPDQQVQVPASGTNELPTGTTRTGGEPVQTKSGGHLTSQLASWSQNVIWTVARYSNYISVISVLLLLAALNSKRLAKLRRHLRRSPGTSNSSTKGSSIGSSQQGKHLIGALRQVSPSSSSRSLMLIAGNNKQPASHKLVSADSLTGGELSEPSQKLLHGLSQQRTLINVNGTLERQQQRINNRYLIMQSDKQQLFNTLDSHSSHSNQYDYIQMPPQSNEQQQINSRTRQQQQQQQQQQLYSNILLSSPGHQVLLYNGQQRLASPRAAPPSPNTRYAPYVTASHASTYAVSGGYQPDLERSLQRAPHRSSGRPFRAVQTSGSASSSSGSSSGAAAGYSPASSAAAKASLLLGTGSGRSGTQR